jgi:Leucine-rich repeat (LRR) protein
MQGALVQLISLDVSENQLTSVPGELRGCSSLQYLKLVANALEELPEQWGPWRALTYLDIR